jgi:hypothetical protein
LAAGAAEETKELIKALSPNHRSRWQVEKVRWELAKANSLVAPNLLEEVSDDKSPHRRLAWAALARHQARLGYGADVLRAAEELNDATVKTMVHIGLAMGEQDRHHR